MKEVVFINGRFLAQPATGVQRYAMQTLLALDKLLDEKKLSSIEFILLIPPDARNIELRAIGIRSVGLPCLGSGHAWEQTCLAWYVGKGFLINFNYSGPVFKRRQLLTLHDATVLAVPEGFSLKYRILHQAIVYLTASKASILMTVSNFSSSEIARLFGVTRDILVGREGWEHALCQSPSIDVLNKYQVTPGEFLLTVGSVKPNKNLQVLIKAMELLGKDAPKLLIVGMKDERIFSSQLESTLSRVSYTGFIPDDEVFSLYQFAGWFVFPSIYEGFGLPAVESMANGCPVIAANASALPEVCGEAAVYFDPEDPEELAAIVKRTSLDANIRAEICKKFPTVLSYYSWEKNAEILFEAVLRHASPSPQAGATKEARQ
jgi:glycosyltransferase involved in cell wall biosynthesis